MTLGELMTTTEAAEMLRLRPKSVRNKVAAGVFVEGIHFHRRRGIGIRFRRSRLLEWLEGGAAPAGCGIPLATRAGRRRA